MRIALCGTTNQQITQFANDFRQTFPMYKLHVSNSDKILAEKGFKIANQDAQNIILNTLIDETLKYDKSDNVIYNYSLLDNLVCSMWLNTQEIISDEFIKKSMVLIKQALHFYDIILYFPNLPKYTPVDESLSQLSEAESQTAQLYYTETGYFYAALHEWYLSGNEQIFDFKAIDGCPAMVEIYGNPQERIQMTKLYIDTDGQPFGKNPKDSLITLPTLEEQHEIDKIRALNNK